MGQMPLVASHPRRISMAAKFAMTWSSMDDELWEKRDFKLLTSLHPGLDSLEDWMKRTGYDGTDKLFLKGMLDRKDRMAAAAQQRPGLLWYQQ